MENDNFIDYVKIFFRSGNGGAGSAHLLRTAHDPKAGPDGGDGGRVPLGTIVKDAETDEFIGEILEDGQEFVVLPGGRGGQGNVHFKTATRQTPRFAQPGEPGQEGWFILELKVLADIGLVGFPNAGKSTLISSLSNARPKIADYPFTTLKPNLGMVAYRDFQSFVIADIPGIIEGASEGKGIGLRFLRHIERNAALLFLVPCISENIKKEYQILLNELKAYNEELMDKKRVLAITKCDLMPEEELKKIEKKVPKDIPVIFISAHAQKNLTQLKDKLWEILH